MKLEEMKKAIVTGGAGFIGSHLAESLANRGYHIIILDDLSTGRLSNIEPLLRRTNVEFVQGSIIDLPLIQRLFRGIDYIFHQAAIPSILRSVENPLSSHEVNITGTLKVLFAARDSGVKKVIYASSSSVYGDTPTLPKREDMRPTPQSPYAVTKLAGEHYCRVFHQVYGLSTVCLRYFNVYGPRQNPESEYAAAIPKFIKSVLQESSPTIFGDGEQSRDFTFVKDVVEANILAAENDASGIFNIGTGKSTTINELVKLIIDGVGADIGLVYREPKLGDIRHSLADISSAKTFGYDAKYDLVEGLRETMR